MIEILGWALVGSMIFMIIAFIGYCYSIATVKKEIACRRRELQKIIDQYEKEKWEFRNN